MKIVKNTVVSIHYTLKSINDVLIQDTRAYSPEYYLHGAGTILPGLEEGLNGKQVGDDVEVILQPSEAFGQKEDSLVLRVYNAELSDLENLEEGELILLSDGREGVLLQKNTEFSLVDTNHPLAGETLVYTITILEVRPATEEEIETGGSLIEVKACSGASGCC